jgi:hypothetical protein
VSTELGADELRIRALLVAHEVGPDAVPNAIPPRPAGRPRDWLDDILEADPTPEPEPEPVPEEESSDEPETTPEPGSVDGQEEQLQPRPKPPRSAKKSSSKKRKKPKPGAARAGVDTRPALTRQSLADAWDNIPTRLKWLAYHASAAYLGWSMGLVGWSTYVTAWIATTGPAGPAGPQAVFWYVAAAGTVLVYRRTRTWWTPAAWLAAVPVTSTVVGVLLYAPHS